MNTVQLADDGASGEVSQIPPRTNQLLYAGLAMREFTFDLDNGFGLRGSVYMPRSLMRSAMTLAGSG